MSSLTIPVEVKGDYNEHYPGFMTKILTDGVMVTFTNVHSPPNGNSNSTNETLKSGSSYKYAFESVRLAPSLGGQQKRSSESDTMNNVYHVGDSVEVWLPSNLFSSSHIISDINQTHSHGNENGQNGSKESSEKIIPGPYAWWEARISKVTAELLGVDVSLSKDYQVKKISEIVEKDQLRPRYENAHLTMKSLHSYTVLVSPMVKLNLDDSTLLDFVRRLNGPVLVDFDEAKHEIKFFSSDQNVIHRVKLLEESFARLILQKQSILSQKSRRSEDREGTYSEIFSVEEDLIGMAIGYQGRNIAEARAVPGVLNITLDDSTKTFYVYSKTKEAAKEAREKIEFMRDIIQVPETFVSRLIGRNGVILQEVVDKSQVIRVYVAGDLNQSGTNYVFPNGVIAPHVDGMFPFQVVGRRSQLEDARLLIDYNIDMFRHIDEEQGPRNLNSKDGLNYPLTKENSLPPMSSRRGGVRGKGPRGFGRGSERGMSVVDDSKPDSKRDSLDGNAPGYHTDSAISDRLHVPRYARGAARGDRGRGGPKSLNTNGSNRYHDKNKDDFTGGAVKQYNNSNIKVAGDDANNQPTTTTQLSSANNKSSSKKNRRDNPKSQANNNAANESQKDVVSHGQDNAITTSTSPTDAKH